MADEIVYKKVTRKADKGLEGKVVAKHGKQTNQKLNCFSTLIAFFVDCQFFNFCTNRVCCITDAGC